MTITKLEFVRLAQESVRDAQCIEEDFTYHDGFLMDYPETIQGEDTWELFLKVLQSATLTIDFDELDIKLV